MLKVIFEENILSIPWPLYVGETFFDGTKVTKASSCSIDCINGSEFKTIHKCSHGLSHVSKTIGDHHIVVSGVYIDSMTASQKLNRKYKSQKASVNAINNWLSEVESKLSSINKVSNKIAKDKFDQFHEFAKWANEINFYSNRLIDKSKNTQFSGFEAATEDLKSLYKTSVMLLDSLDTSSIYFNPVSASFGHKRPTDIYSMLHKISLVLSHSKSNKGRVKIQINGRVKNKHRVYESFKIIPLSLLQNALKYRKTGDVEIQFEEVGNNLTMKVISYGDFILEDELPKLFDRGFRAASALKSKLEGNGLGLYVANIVAKAHGFDLSVKSELMTGKEIAKNTFTICIN
jgi:light-regulated signal transduction histidine kinase (bacteriophytochrome)